MNVTKNIFLLSVLTVLCTQASLTWGGSIPIEYQVAISKALPGYEILRNEDFVQDESQIKNFLSPDEISKRKKREFLGFIVGRFNNDRFPDFAALVVNRSIEQERLGMTKSENWKGTFASRLVVCLGTSTPREYRCEVLSTLYGDFIDLPFWVDLDVSKIGGEIPCGNHDEPIGAFYPEGWKGKRPDEVSARKLRSNYDAIGEYAIGNNAGLTLFRGADGIYLNCAYVD